MERPAARPSLIAALVGFALAGLLGREAVALPVLMPPAPEAGVAVWITALVGLLGAVAGALGKWLLEQWGAQRAADRAFAASATQQVVELAQKYYWSLANHAGSLGISLTGHVQMRAVHIMLGGNDEATLKRQLDAMSKPFAEDTFPTFCRLVSLFDEFQFRGRNTYLLQSHFAGETCRRLYNAFVEALSLDEETGSLQTLTIAAVMRAPLPESLSGRSEKCIGELPSQVFMKEIVPIQLNDELEAWKDWLRDRTPEVVIAADALRTYSELLSHELAQLYETFFGRAGIASFTRGEDTVERYRKTVEADRWPRVLRPRSLALIEVVSLRPSLLKPLGRGLMRPEREPKAPVEYPTEAVWRTDLGKWRPKRRRSAARLAPAPRKPPRGGLRSMRCSEPSTSSARHASPKRMAESPSLTRAQERRWGRLRGYLPQWIVGRSTADHAGLAQLQAWQWALIEHLALEGVAGEEALAAWRSRRDALQGASDPWDFVLDAVEANQCSRRHDQGGAVDCFRRAVARLRARCEAARRRAGYDEDGHDLEFLRLALAVASTRLAELLVSPGRPPGEKTALAEAEVLLREACDLCPREIFARESLVRFLLQQGRCDEAEACAREIATVDTSPVAQQESHRILGDVYTDLADWAETRARLADAAKHLEQAAASYKESIASYRESFARRPAQTAEVHERIAERLATVLERQALLALRQGRDAEAVRRLQTELQRLGPEDADEPDRLLRTRILGALVLTSAGEGDIESLLDQLRVARRSDRASAALPEVARLARDLHGRPDIRRGLRLKLFRRAVHEQGTRARRDVAHAQLELFAQPPRRSAPFVSLVTELMIEFEANCFEPDGGETVLRYHVEGLRRRLSASYGIELPSVQVRRGDYVWPKNLGYLLFVRESTVIHGQLSHGRDLYIGPVRAFREAGIPHTRHAPPGLSGAAAWVPRTQRPALEELGLERVTPLRLLTAHLETVIEANLSRLVGREQVHRLFELHGLSPREVAPYSTAAAVGAVTRLVTVLLAKRIPVRAFAAIHGAAVRGLADQRPFDAVVDDLRQHLLTGVEPRIGGDTPAEVEVSGRETEASSRKEPVPEPGRSAQALPRPHQASRTASPARGIEAEAVPLTVRVELPASCGAADEAWRRAFRRRLTRRAEDLIDALGLPAKCQIEVKAVDELPFGMPHTMKVEGRAYRVRRIAQPAGEVDTSTAAERAFTTLFDGRCLLAIDSITCAVAADPRLRASSDAEPIAKRLLRCSLAHGIAVDRLLDRWPTVAREAVREEFMSHALELLVAELAAPELPVHIARNWYDALTAREAPPHLPAADHGLSDWREDLRTKVFFELGFWVPPLVLQPDPWLGENAIALRLNDAPMPARRMPGNELQRQELESAFLDEVSRVAACLLDIRTVEQILADLHDERFHPRLVADLLEELDICSVLGVFRDLVRERCSIRDQRAIIEALLVSRDSWCREAAPTADRPSAEDLLRRARLALMPQLTAQHARHLGSVPTFVLDPELTARITADPRLSEEERCRLLDAVQRAKAAGLPVGTPPLVLADPLARRRLRRLIEVEFPDLPVLAEQELEPKVCSQPLAALRI